MSEATERNENISAEEKAEQAKAELLEKVKKGSMKLAKPILSRDNEVKEITYDFTGITGVEYAKTMDSINIRTGAFTMTQEQALALFALAVEKTGCGLDAVDIKERLGMVDARVAVQKAQLFSRYRSSKQT